MERRTDKGESLIYKVEMTETGEAVKLARLSERLGSLC